MSPSHWIPSVASTSAGGVSRTPAPLTPTDQALERALASRLTCGVALAAVLAGAVLLLLTASASAPVPSALPVHAVLQADLPSFNGVDMRQVAFPVTDEALPAGF